MTMTYNINPEKERIDVVLAGTIGVGALIGGLRDLLDDPAFDPMYDVLADCADARIGRVTFGLAEAVIAISGGNEARRTAIVMPDDDGAEHVKRFVALRNDQRRTRAFIDRQDAEAWLADSVPVGVTGGPY
ncbi:MAG: hypothetical protein RID42_14990 [Alphaproteobacteria bacterium]